MKIELLYTYMCRPSESTMDYTPIHQRFLNSLRQFPYRQGAAELVISTYGGYADTNPFQGLDASFVPYFGGGFDCGAYQAYAMQSNADLVVFCNTQIYFWRHGWMERIVGAFEKHGPGLFGFAGSYENHPHLRTPMIACPPALLREWPTVINGRETAHAFESGPENFTRFVQKKGLPTKMVTWTDELDQRFWRTPQNAFRKGDQSDMIAFDRHSKLWSELADNDPLKAVLARSADGRKG